jgi:hypothetical protein
MDGQLSERDFQAFVKGQFRDIKRMLDISQAQAKSLACSHEVIITKLAELTSPGVFVEGNEPMSKRPRTIRDAYDNRMQNASVVFQGLFNGNLFGDIRDGQKRTSVFFRQLCINPYANEKALGNLFRDSKEDISDTAVTNWLEHNSKEVMSSFRNRRSGFIRFVKDALGMALGVGHIPLENGVPAVIMAWKLKVRDAWLVAKKNAEGEGFFYPRLISLFLLEHAKVSDNYSAYTSGFCSEDTEKEFWWTNLIVLEAFALNVISVCFGRHTLESNIECSERNLGGIFLKLSIELVLRQRSRYDIDNN